MKPLQYGVTRAAFDVNPYNVGALFQCRTGVAGRTRIPIAAALDCQALGNGDFL